ncbi:MAG: amidohydrolase family protein [Alphaproteobacteria bacterium]|nr:amidohydrolase family protein [Alphaproteobacteria bacterium]
MSGRSFAFLLCLFALAAVPAARPAGAETILFEGARIIPGDGGPAIEDGAVLVDGGVISRVGRRAEIAPQEGVRRVDAAGKTIMPALVSAHVHPGFQRGLSYSAENFTRDTVMADLNRALYWGISTVNSLGVEKGEVLYDIRAAQAQGRLGGARLLLAGRGIGAPNAGPGAAAYANIAYEITTGQQALDAVHELAGRHVDGIKIWVDDRGGRAPSLPLALSRTVIDEGHRLGFKVSAHIYYHKDAVELAAAGIDNFAHLVRDTVMSDDLVSTVVAKRIYVMPNMSFPDRATTTAVPAAFEEEGLQRLLKDTEPPEVIARMRASFAGRDEAAAARARAIYANIRSSVAKLAAAHARIILGSDTGLEDHPFGYAEHMELQLMAEAGMPTAEVIVAATSRAAEFLGLADRGVIAAGRRADLLVLDADPLADIRNTRRIAALYIAGKEVDRTAIKAALLGSGGQGAPR